MSGQNTEKQILAMVILLVISVASLGAYVWFDNGRRTEATSEVFERDSERGAHLFATNCRVCHGNDGAGRESNSSLVGVALNKPSNTFAWRTENVGQLAILAEQIPLHDRLRPQRHPDAAVVARSGRLARHVQDREPRHHDHDQRRRCVASRQRSGDRRG